MKGALMLNAIFSGLGKGILAGTAGLGLIAYMGHIHPLDENELKERDEAERRALEKLDKLIEDKQRFYEKYGMSC